MSQPSSTLCETCRVFNVKCLLMRAKDSPIRGYNLMRHHREFAYEKKPETFRDWWLLFRDLLWGTFLNLQVDEEGNANTQDDDSWIVPEHSLIYQGVTGFFKLQPDLRTLRKSAASCELCRTVWEEYSRHCRPFELSEEAMNTGISRGPIFLGTLDWDQEFSQWPYVAAIQLDPVSPKKSSRHLACFEVCAEHGNVPTDGDALGRVQAKSSNDEQCYSLAKEWLENCLHNHQTCRRLYSTFFPSRVLDVSSNPEKVHLVDGSGRHKLYAALSYCWGDQRRILLTQESIWRLRGGIPLTELPKTIRDAVIVTRRLGLDYIWVDALCIFQDHHNPESLRDWAQEASRMRDVYKNAVITIEAAAASVADESFLHAPRTSRQPYCALRWMDKLSESSQDISPSMVYLRPMLDITDGELLKTRIYGRGWTLQERLLAPRTLSFGTQQLSFECAEGIFDESGRVTSLSTRASYEYLSKNLMRRLQEDDTRMMQIARSLALALRLPKNFQFRGTDFVLFGNLSDLPINRSVATYYDFWHLLVSKFSERQLTNEQDRLLAISGLAREFQKITRDTYIAGMWKSDLVTGLDWTSRTLYSASGKAFGRFDKDIGAYVSASGNIGSNPELYPSSIVSGTWPECVRSAVYIAPSWSWASVKGKIFYGNWRQKSAYDFKRIIEHAKVLQVSVEAQGGDSFGRLTGAYLKIRAPFMLIPTLEEPCSNDFVLKTWHRYTRRSSNWYKVPTESAVSEYWQHHAPFEGQLYGVLQLFTKEVRPQAEYNSVDKVYSLPEMTILLLESLPGNTKYRRLCCLHLSLGTVDEIKAAIGIGARFAGLSDAEDRAIISQEFRGEHWKRRTITLV